MSERESSGPAYRLAYPIEVVNRDGEKVTRWVDVGTAWRAKEGKLRLVIDALPLQAMGKPSLELVAFPPSNREGGRR